MWILINLNELPFFLFLNIVRKYSAGSIILFCEIQEGVCSVSVQMLATIHDESLCPHLHFSLGNSQDDLINLYVIVSCDSSVIYVFGLTLCITFDEQFCQNLRSLYSWLYRFGSFGNC